MGVANARVENATQPWGLPKTSVKRGYFVINPLTPAPLSPGPRNGICVNNCQVLEVKKISKLTWGSSSFAPKNVKMNLEIPSVNYKLFNESPACLLHFFFPSFASLSYFTSVYLPYLFYFLTLLSTFVLLFDFHTLLAVLILLRFLSNFFLDLALLTFRSCFVTLLRLFSILLTLLCFLPRLLCFFASLLFLWIRQTAYSWRWESLHAF